MRGARSTQRPCRRLGRRNARPHALPPRPGRILQLRNGGTDTGRRRQFDKVIRDEVVNGSRLETASPTSTSRPPEARLRLLQDAERNKIELSDRAEVTFYRPDYFAIRDDPRVHAEPPRTRGDHPAAGRRRHPEIESLLDSVGMAPAQVSLCLVVGGMAAMPSIRSRLHELFGPERVMSDEQRNARLSGSRWIAHDAQRLVLAKPIELELARGSRLPLLRAGTAMPTDGESSRETVHLYCTDPIGRHREVPHRRADRRCPRDPRQAIDEPRSAWWPSSGRTAPPLHRAAGTRRRGRR